MRLAVGLISAFVFAVGMPAAAGELKYLGKSTTPGRGHILHGGQAYEVDRDTDIPGGAASRTSPRRRSSSTTS